MQPINEFLESKGMKPKTIQTYSSIINKVTSQLGEQFTETELEELFVKFRLQPRSYNLYRTVMNFYTQRYLGYSLSFKKAKVDQSLPTYITIDEFRKFLSVIPNIKHKLGFALMYGSGLRVSEVTVLRKHNINFDNQIILVKSGKGGKDRHTIIPSKTVTFLDNYCKIVNDYVFPTYRGHIHTRSFEERLKKAIRDSGLTKHFTCHDLRHSFAINLVNKGIDIEIVRKILGHSSLRTTQIYLQCKTDNLEAIAKLC